MQPSDITAFLQKFDAGTSTEAEHQYFAAWLKTAPMAEVETALDQFHSILSNNHLTAAGPDPDLVAQIETALNQYELGNAKKQVTGKIILLKQMTRLAAAVLLFLIAGTAVWLAVKNTGHRVRGAVAALPARPVLHEALPGSNKAILMLADGSAIALDSTKNGKIARQGNVQVNKLAGGQLVYQTLGSRQAEIAFNTLTTPRGGQFKLILPDESEVWLNAASSITYPTAFTGNERTVDITGEAYFEIAHNASMPFKVRVNGMEVKVLGTHFNINAYTDEAAVKTSLLQGSISLSKGSTSIILQPGEQAQLAPGEAIKIINNADMDEAVAWKNGYFSFNRADLQTVMRQLARWYAVDIRYEGKLPERFFGGKIDRNSNASEVLKILEESKVHFSIENKEIIVKP